MKRVLLIFLVLFLLAAIGVGVFFSTFDADRYRPIVAQRLEAALDRPVQLKRISLRWKGGIAAELQGLAILADRSSGSPPLLEVGSVSALLRLVPLLKGDLQIGSVLIQAPIVRLVRRPDGTIEILGLTPSPAAAGASTPAASKAGSAAPLVIRELEVLEGRATFSDPNARPPLEIALEEIRLKAGLDLRAEQLDLKEASAKLGAGTLFASGTVRRFSSRPEGDLRLKGEGIVIPNVNLLREMFDRFTLIPGLIDTLLSRLPPSYAEKLTQRDTLLRPFDLRFALQNGVVSFPDFRVATDSFELAGSGQYGLDGSLEIPAQIFIEPDLSKALIQSVQELRFLTDDQWRIVLPVRVAGSVQKPSISPDLQYVASKLLTNKAQDLVGELLNKAIGKKEEKAQQPGG